MLANTLTITINGVANVLTRVNQDNFSSVYQKLTATDSMVLQIRNSTEKASSAKSSTGAIPASEEQVLRHNMFFEHIVYATPTSTEKYYTVTATMRSRRTSDPAWLDKVTTGFTTLLSVQQLAIIGGDS